MQASETGGQKGERLTERVCWSQKFAFIRAQYDGWIHILPANHKRARYELWKGTLFLNTKENALYFTAWYTLQIMIFLFSICILFSRTFFNQEKQIDLCLLYIVSENWNPLYIVSEKYIYTVSENCTKIPNRPNIYNVITNKGKTTILFLSHLTS